MRTRRIQKRKARQVCAPVEQKITIEPSVVGRFLVRTSECMVCDETNHYYYIFYSDGCVFTDYEGCGGILGSRRDAGREIPIDEAIEELSDRFLYLGQQKNEIDVEMTGMLRVIKLRKMLFCKS